MPPEERYEKPLAYDPGRLVRTVDEPIRIGSLLWVFTDPHRGYEFAYNRWYERDHYYAGCMVGANTVAGSRWVATRDSKAVRFPDPTPMPFDRLDGSYACLYFILDEHHAEWDAWAAPQANHLYEVDRGFHHRTHYNTGFYRYDWRAYRDPDPVPIELALDHRYPGMVVAFVEGDPTAVDAWFDAYLPAWLPGSPIASVSCWSNIPLSDDKPDFVPVDTAAATRRLLVGFVDEDPLASWGRWEALARALESSGVGRVAFASPFVATVIGTDRYIDELWPD
jgi:hypothetical protein